MISLLLIGVSTFSGEGFAQKITESFFNVFMGLTKEERQIVVDLSVYDLSEEMRISIESINAEILNETPQKTKEKKKVLIYHTHTDEAYLKGDKDYVETSVGRTLDERYSVVSVGNSLKTALEGYGFTVIHDKTNNVRKGFNKAYETSYETIEPYIGKVDVFIDMHRDAYMGQSKNTVTKDGVEYARLCFVVAKGENYTYKPNWEDNYKLAQTLTNKLNEICPEICKDIIFKNTRFNQHVSKSCLLIEMGNEQNTVEEVRATALIVAQAFNEIY